MKDIFGVCVFLIVFSVILFFTPEVGGYFLEANNFIPADPFKTPPHIAPLWYFTAYYSILRAVPPLFNSQFPGVIAMGMSIVMLFLLPWLDRSPVKSIRYRGALYKWALALFVIAFFILSYLGTQSVSVINTWLARICSIIYFAFFIFMPWYTRIDKTKPEPERVTA